MKKEYDIGILTFYYVPNYGTFAQAYSLQRVLKKLFPEREVFQISYLNKKHFDFYFSKFPKCGIRNKKFLSEFIDRNKKNSNFNLKKENFIKSYSRIDSTEKLSANNLEKTKFNHIILGSDIIWDYSFPLFGNDKYLFGNSLTANRISSYAASFGTVKSLANAPDYVINGLKKIDNVSVRDLNSQKLVKEVRNEDVPLVLDPTWLWDFSNDDNLPSIEYSNYIILYGQDFSKKYIEELRKYSKENNKIIICLDCNNDNYEWCDVLIRQSELTPFEWISYFKNAYAVATSTFHGLTFALIFNKRLAFCATKFILDKADKFLDELNLLELYTTNKTVYDMMEYNYNFQNINSIINKKREASIFYLKHIFEGE